MFCGIRTCKLLCPLQIPNFDQMTFSVFGRNSNVESFDPVMKNDMCFVLSLYQVLLYYVQV